MENRLNKAAQQAKRDDEASVTRADSALLPNDIKAWSAEYLKTPASERSNRWSPLIGNYSTYDPTATQRKQEAAELKLQEENDYGGLWGFLRGMGENALEGIRSANAGISAWLADAGDWLAEHTGGLIDPGANISLVDTDPQAAAAAARAATSAVRETAADTEKDREYWRQRGQEAKDYLGERQEEIDTGEDVEILTQKGVDAQQRAAEIREAALEDRGIVGQVLFDVGSTGLQWVYDALLGALIPGGALASAGLRGAGSGMLEARLAGANLGQQLLYGIGTGGVEVLTEKISNISNTLTRVFGKGFSDGVVNRLINRLTTNAAGRSVLRTLASAGGEGVEEMVSDVVNPFLQLIYDGDALDQMGTWDYWGDVLYDGLVGSVFGGVVQGAETGVNRLRGNRGGNTAQTSTNTDAVTTQTDVSSAQNQAPNTQTGADTTAPAETAVEAPTAPQTATEVEALLSSGTVSNSVAERIINTPELRAQFEALTGQQLTGTKSEMRNTIKEFARQRAADAAVERFEADVAEMNGEGVTQTPQAANTPVMPDSSATVSPESSVGAMARGATVGHTPEVVENQERALEGAMGEQYEGLGVHERLPNQDSMFYAQQRFDADYEGEVADLRNKQAWDAIDYDTGMLILQKLKAESMAHPEDATARAAMRDWENVVRARSTTAGQTLQAHRKWTEFTPENAYADAVDILYGDNVRRGMTEEQKQTILQETKEASEQLESIAPEDTASTIELIKRLSQQRRTTGLLRNDTSSVMNMALQQVAQQEGGAEFLRNVAQAQIRNLAIDYERVSFTERMRTLRTLNLLSKPATTLRNLIGNFVFDPLESISNNTGVALDWLLSQYTGQRTTALDKSWFSEAKRRGSVDALVRSIIEVGLDADTSEITNRYEQGGGRTFRMTGNFIERLLSTWEKYNGYALTSTDEFAKGGTRAEAERGLRDLADRGLLVDAQEAQAEQRQRGRNVLAPGTVVRALDRNNFGHVVAYDPANDTYLVHFESREGATADVELPASQVVDTKAAGRARHRLTGGRDSGAAQRAQLSTDDYITQRAEEIAKQRTFQNDSIASDVMLGLRDVGNILHVGDIGVGDVTVPFARVPANVATQAINYSPAGLSNGTVQIARVLRAARNGTLTPQQQAAAVMSVGRGLSGSVGIALFAGLALKGILNVAGADDDDERAFDTGEGLSGTQLNLSALERWIRGESTEWQDGDTLLNIGFLEPINAQMAMGSMIADSYLEDGTLSARDMLNASLEGTMQSVIDLPAMSSIQELLDAWQYASGDDITERALNAAMSYAGSQATSFVVPNMVAGIAAGLDNTVRAPYTGETPLEDMLYQFMNDIPGLRENVPERLDSWGNERQYTDNDVLNFLNNTILPGSVTQYQSSAVNQELRRLGADAMPRSSAPSDFSIDGEKIVLTQEQKDAYQKAYGEAALSSLDRLIESETYQSLSDADKLKVVESVYDYANAIAKQSIDSRYELEGASAKAAEYDNPGEYFMFNEALKNIEDSKGADTAAFDAVMEDYAKMDASEQNTLVEMLGENTRFDDIVEAYEAGISPEEWYDAYDKYKELDANGNLSANDAATEFAKWLDTESKFTEQQQSLLEEQLGFFTQLRANSDRYDALIDAGFAPAKADAVYDAVSALEPEQGKTQVSDQQRYEAIVGTSGLTEQEKVDALTEYEGTSSGDKQKFKTAYAYGISPDEYVAFLGLKEDGVGDADGNGSYKADETTALVNAFLEMYPDASRADAALLWAMTNKSKSGNPFANFNQEMIEWDIAP